MAFYLTPNTLLPWSSSAEDDERFKRILKIALIALVVLSIPITLIDVPEQTREEKAKLPPQLARVILEKQELPPPKPVEPPKVEEKKPEEPKPEPEKKPEPVKEKPPEKPNVAKAREKAAASGLLQFKDDLMEMRESLDVSAIDSANVARGEATAATVDRSMVTSGVTTASGGINTAALSRDTGGVALSGRETTKVESDLAKSTGTTAADSGGQAQESAARSDEEIRKVMEQHKGAIFSIYNRALRQNPALQGKVVVKIIIESSGKISDVSIVSVNCKIPIWKQNCCNAFA